MKLRKKNISLGWITGIVTFGVGVSVYGFSVLSDSIARVDDQAIRPIPINPCSLVARSNQFGKRLVVVHALLYQIEEGIMVYPGGNRIDCGMSDPVRGFLSTDYDIGAFTILDLDGYDGQNSDLSDLFASSKQKKEIDVEIEGTLVRSPTTRSPLRYKIIPTTIKLISNWRPSTPKAWS